MRRGVRPKSQVMFLGGITQVVEHDPRLHTRNAPLRIDLENSRHVPGKIQHDGNIAALARKRSAATAAKQRRAKFAAQGNGRENIVHVMGTNYADRHLPVVGSVGRVECAAAGIEANLASNLRAQSLRQPRGVGR